MEKKGKQKHCPDITDVVDVDRMFYVGHQVIFIGCYFQMESKVLRNSDEDNDDDDDNDRRGANAKWEF